MQPRWFSRVLGQKKLHLPIRPNIPQQRLSLMHRIPQLQNLQWIEHLCRMQLRLQIQ